MSQYKKHTHREHILELPDTYIGSTELHQEMQWVYNGSTGKMEYRSVAVNPGFYKLVDEIIVNARDAVVRGGVLPVKMINVEIQATAEGPKICVENDGDGIPLDIHPEVGVPIPEMIFGHLLTSSNYDKGEEKIVGGKNGYGGKCHSPDTNLITWDGGAIRADIIAVGDKLVGDDGTPRTVLGVIRGRSDMYEVSQAHGDSYKVNENHLLTLHMPDHKVIFWNTAKNGWSVLWWNNDTSSIQAKCFVVEQPTITCPECNETLSGNLGRHYSRVHKDKELPKSERKRPTIDPENTEDIHKARREAEEFCTTIPDNNIFDMEIKEYMALNETTKKRLAGIRGDCIQWSTQEVALDPYVLGLWLGDGLQTGYGHVCFGEKDPEIINYLTEWGAINDTNIRKTGKYTYYFSSITNFKKKGKHPFRNLLAKYNLINNKHIPKEYLVNDRDTRLKVLAGIIDTDGSVSRDGSRINITQGTNHTELAHQIVYLARSLGFSVTIRKQKTTWTYKGEKKTGEAFSINISGRHIGDIPTLLPRKKCASTVSRNTSKSTGWLDIMPIGDGDYVGIKVDGNERYLINDFTATHNCTNIFSNEFSIDVRNHAQGKRYRQTWRSNMSVCEKPLIRKSEGSTGHVRIEFLPDIARFPGVSLDGRSLTADMEAIIHTRVVELAAMVSNSVKVTWNKKPIAVNSFDKFVKLFLREGGQMAYEQAGPRWDIAAVPLKHLVADPDEKHASYVNGIRTKKGGKHVEYVQRQVLTDFCEGPAKKKKMDIKPAQLKESVMFFINSTIVNPSFDSQTKEYLSSAASKFGSTPKFGGKLMDSLVKAGLLDEAQAILDAKLSKDAKKTDGKKKSKIRGMAKLEDALWAGTAKSEECTLILTEGDSAATSAISGLQVVGRERWGVFPLRGKILNVKDVSLAKVNANEEFTSIKRILGLEHGKVYKNISSLRYGRVMVMADQDHDGSHIKGLLMNIFHTEWPSLLQMGFICSILTPILKARKGQQTMSFYSQGAFDAWKAGLGETQGRGWEIKYYKGLGTSTPQEAREWFENMNQVQYQWDPAADNSISLAFSKSRADDRKTWLGTYDPARILNTDGGTVPITNFINDELIHFSNADNLRSIPHMIDGLKPSQRKILYCALKRNLTKEIKVAQLAGYVSEHASYHHGEVSLMGTIVGMAQNFVGSNNINVMQPIGQFGSRLQGGDDAAAARYIHTALEQISGSLFHKSDDSLLKAQEDDGIPIEPEYYLPSVPLLVINGALGIGTGFSCNIPPHNPKDVVALLRARIRGLLPTLENRPLDPWWQGFKGRVIRTDNNTWQAQGVYEYNDDNHTITVTELPVGVWTKSYKETLDKMCMTDEAIKESGLKNFDDLYTDVEVRFVLYLTEDVYDMAKDMPNQFMKKFGLTSSWKTSNMIAFNEQMKLTKYHTVGDMMEAFYLQRIGKYVERREAQLAALEKERVETDARRRFLMAVIEDRMVLMKQSDEAIVAQMKRESLPPLSNEAKPDDIDAYEYLLRMRIDRVKQSAIKEMEDQVERLMEKIRVLQAKTPSDIWEEDLVDFEDAWEKMIIAREAAKDGKPAPKRAKVTKRKTG
jgi:DNA topoisomerase-2